MIEMRFEDEFVVIYFMLVIILFFYMYGMKLFRKDLVFRVVVFRV